MTRHGDWLAHRSNVIASADMAARRKANLRWHVPQVCLRADGRWGVICAACSADVGDYINPCRTITDLTDWPPPILDAVK